MNVAISAGILTHAPAKHFVRKHFSMFSFPLRLSLRILRYLFCRFEKCCADDRIYDVSYQCSETYIRKKMISHVDTVITVNNNKYTGDQKTYDIFCPASLFADICKQWQGKHH